MQYARDAFLDSLVRCRASGGFTADFYDRLLGTSDEIRARFRLTNMQQQMLKLAESLEVCALAVEGKPEGLARLKELGRTHDKYHHNILPEWYPLWLEAIVATAATHDPQWTPEVERGWRTVLRYVVERMASQYDP